ncbi:NADH-quinone oxidoreductase subunit A [Streptomyces sp. NPDC003077]|uniref:NADH-quinone oxidoreductase subunit A n=1 Tax=Streptomyces sp. NPDC003077 TaxID=3154443 RepID=UPI0033B3B0F0
MSTMNAWGPVLLLLGVVLIGLFALYGCGSWLTGSFSRRPSGSLSESRSRPPSRSGFGKAAAVQPFTGGLPPQEHAFSRFHVRWYPVAMIFLAFDMEMLFMYPWVKVVTTMGTGAVVEMFLFLAILFAGVGYAWREGAFRWA